MRFTAILLMVMALEAANRPVIAAPETAEGAKPAVKKNAPPKEKPARPKPPVRGKDPQPGPKPPVAAVAPKPPKDPAEPPPKLPRFAAFKHDETNMRVGPGPRYPIEWVYRRRDLPVEVEREHDVWRYVRDHEGVRGWVHQVVLNERRTFLVLGADATIRADANDTAKPVALLKPGVIGRLRSCEEGAKWCQIQSGTFRGYLRRDQFWGLLPNEVVTPS